MRHTSTQRTLLTTIALVILTAGSALAAAPAAPEHLTASNSFGSGDVFLTWDAVAGATGYVLWRSDSGGALTRIDLSAVTAYHDAGLASDLYRYSVSASDGVHTGAGSAIATVLVVNLAQVPAGALA